MDLDWTNLQQQQQRRTGFTDSSPVRRSVAWEEGGEVTEKKGEVTTEKKGEVTEKKGEVTEREKKGGNLEEREATGKKGRCEGESDRRAQSGSRSPFFLFDH